MMFNQKKKSLAGLLLVALFALLLVGCKQPAPPVVESGTYPLTVSDSYERQVTINQQPETIVSLSPSSTEILFALGLGSKVVGVTEVCDYPEEALAIEKMGGFQGVDVEKIVAAEPGLILADSLTTKEVVEQLADLGFPVLALRATSIEDVFGHIGLVGKAAGVVAEAEALEKSLRDRLAAISGLLSAVPEAELPSVFYEVWYDPLSSIGPETFIHDAIAKAGGNNVTGDAASDWPLVDLELIIDKSPQVVLLSHGGQTPEEVIQRPNWQTVEAVVNNRVYVIDPDIFNRPGPRLVDAVEEVARLLHPHLFE